jgi:hypothetical protein
VPRDLGDVLHWFLDPPAADPDAPAEAGFVLAVDPRDVLRAAFAWNLAAALAERAPGATLVARGPPGGGLRWPRTGPARLVAVAGGDPARLAEAAQEAARGGVPVLTCVPPEALGADPGAPAPAHRALVLVSAAEVDSGAAGRLLEAFQATWSGLRLGAVLHGVRRIADARRAFDDLAAFCTERLTARLTSYGLLLDDLDVYRSVVEREPLVESRPDGRAARALRDVAGWMHRDLEAEA